MQYCDTDSFIEHSENVIISDVFASQGEQAFRSMEQKAFQSISSDKEDFVVATGGGFPIFNDLMASMKDNGIVIYLSLDRNHLYRRLNNRKSLRPIIKGSSDLRSSIDKLLTIREPIYSQADFIVDNRFRDKTIQKILDYLKT